MKILKESNLNDFEIDGETLIKYNGRSKKVSVPNGVTIIAETAFAHNSNIVTVVLPDGLTEIGGSAFVECTQLAHINIPDSVTFIGVYAFRGCVNLEEITLTDSIIGIGSHAFSHTDIASIHIPAKIKRIPRGMCSFCPSLTTVEIHSGVDIIDNGAFQECVQLSNLTILGTNVIVGENTFSGCRSLADGYGFVIVEGTLYDYIEEGPDVIIPDTVTTIDSEMFSNASNITSITVPASVKNIGEGFCADCESLNDIFFFTEGDIDCGTDFLYNCTNLEHIYTNSKELQTRLSADGWKVNTLYDLYDTEED